MFDQDEFNRACDRVVIACVAVEHYGVHSPDYDRGRLESALDEYDRANDALDRIIATYDGLAMFEVADMRDDAAMLNHVGIALAWFNNEVSPAGKEHKGYSPYQMWMLGFLQKLTTSWWGKGAQDALAEAAKQTALLNASEAGSPAILKAQ